MFRDWILNHTRTSENLKIIVPENFYAYDIVNVYAAGLLKRHLSCNDHGEEEYKFLDLKIMSDKAPTSFKAMG